MLTQQLSIVRTWYTRYLSLEHSMKFFSSPHAREWTLATDSEYQSLIDNNTWDLVELPGIQGQVQWRRQGSTIQKCIGYKRILSKTGT